MAKCRHVAKQLHLPFQSGNDRVLGEMNRRYTREKYLAPVHDGNPGLHPPFPDHRQALGDAAVLLGGGEDPLPGFVNLPKELRKAPQGLGPEDQIHMAVGFLYPLRHPLFLGHPSWART